MTFDMTQCKIGDKLKTRGGKCVKLTDVDAGGFTDGEEYPFIIDDEYAVTLEGTYFKNGSIEPEDIVGFWEEEEKQLSEDDESFPTIEVRTPHIAKIITYRVHFNEMFHRDMSEQEAVAIYQQLKELLGEK
jgi:hypothetical protein